MSAPVTEPVHFVVSVHATRQDDGHWVARTLETTIFAFGDTREDAERSAGDANAEIVRHLKEQGMEALVAFMTKYGITYSIGSQPLPEQSHPERLTRAA